VANIRTSLKRDVRVRSPNTDEHCSPMFAVRLKCSRDNLASLAGRHTTVYEQSITRRADVQNCWRGRGDYPLGEPCRPVPNP
jgi:hypothetical protein